MKILNIRIPYVTQSQDHNQTDHLGRNNTDYYCEIPALCTPSHPTLTCTIEISFGGVWGRVVNRTENMKQCNNVPYHITSSRGGPQPTLFVHIHTYHLCTMVHVVAST